MPVSIVYTGSPRAGAAGQGWEVPISYVRRSTSVWRRKPWAYQTSPTTNEPRGMDRVTVSLDGHVTQMRSRGSAWWPQRGSTFMELREVGGGWSLKTLDNLEYIFRPVGETNADVSQSAPDLWLLTEIRDSIGGDKVTLEYEVPADGDCGSGLSLSRVSYAYDAAGTTPLYTLELGYGVLWRPVSGNGDERGCGYHRDGNGDVTEYAHTFEHVREDGTAYDRSQVLRNLRVKARNNLAPAAAAKEIRAYQLEYDFDPTNDRPRLRKVTRTGEEGVPGSAIPVAAYEYGALSATEKDGSQTIRYSKNSLVPRPDLPQEFTDALSSTEVSLETFGHIEFHRSRTRHMLRDFTGDGLPDLVYRDGDVWYLTASRLTEDGPRFIGPTSKWTEPAELFDQTTRRHLGDDPSARWDLDRTQTWTQYADWDGDGRLDVIDTRAGSDLDHWKVWLNRAAADDTISWQPVEVDISPLRRHLRQTGVVYIAEDEVVSVDRVITGPRTNTRTCTEQRCVDGTCETPVACPSGDPMTIPPPPQTVFDTMTDWKLEDINADGYLDFVAGTLPVGNREDGVWLALDPFPAPRCEDEPHGVGDPYRRLCRFEHRRWADAIGWNNLMDGIEGNEDPAYKSAMVAFLNRHGAFQGVNGSPFPEYGHEIGEAATGIEHWTNADPDGLAAGLSQQHAGLFDRANDGVLRRAERSFFWGPFADFESDRPTVCPGTGSWRSLQTRGAADLDGDGREDLIEGNTVRFNLAGGYGLPRRVTASQDMQFALSLTTGECGNEGRSIAGLTDLNGDGVPDLLNIIDDELWMAEVVPDKGDVLAAQRLISIDNGYGATTYVRYGNAKADVFTKHSVPFPEIVVREVGTVAATTGAPLDAPTYYAYGGASMVYDSLSASWVFPGYERQLTLRGVSVPGSPERVSGLVTVTDRSPVASAGATFEAHLASGQVTRVSTFETIMDREPEQMLLWNGSPFHGEASQIFATRVLVNDQGGGTPIVPPEALECGDLDPVTGALVSTLQCRKNGLVYAAESSSWEGVAAPPLLANAMAGSRVEAVDQFGRPTYLVGLGDRRRIDDDVCTTIVYASPAGAPASPFPSVVATVMLTDCGLPRPGAPTTGVPVPLSGVRFRYDGLPHGQVGRGQLTARDVDRYGPAGLMGSHEVEAFTYNTLGEIETSTSTRTQGSVATRASWFTYDTFGATLMAMSTQASDTPVTLTTSALTSTWPSRGSREVDHAGVVTRVEYDAHGRMKREIIENGTEHTTRQRHSYDDSVTGRRLTIESFPGTTLVGSEDEAAERVRAHVSFDQLGRTVYRQVELGADYGAQSLVSGLTEYDELGRPAFVAAPFETSTLPFVHVPGGTPRYGTTTVYDRRNRPIRTVTAFGRNETVLETNVASDIFVRTMGYDYANGQLHVYSSGGDENDPASAHHHVRDEAWSTAIGRELRRTRTSASGVGLDLVEQEWDRLGRVIATRRYANPATGSGAVVTRSEYDSLGRRLSFSEPGVSPRSYLYDEEGNEIAMLWVDGTSVRSIENLYDGFGRMTRSRRITDGVVESEDKMYWDELVGGSDQPVSDVVGRLSAVTTSNVGSVYYSYDAYGRPASSSYRYLAHGNLVRESATFAAGGRLRSLELQAPHTQDSITYEHDSAGRVRRVNANGSTLFEATDVSAKGQYRRVQYKNGVVETNEYASSGPEELLSWSAATSSGTYTSRNLAYDGSGRITMERHQTPSLVTMRGYEFDSMGRVQGSVQLGGLAEGIEWYTHDPLGNILTRQATNGAGNRTYQFDAVDPDRLCRADVTPNTGTGCHFTYDGSGNMTVDQSAPGSADLRTFTYDTANRITKAKKFLSTVSFLYGPAGRAMTRVDTGDNPRTVWHFGGLIEETWPGHSASNIRTQRLVPGPLGIVASLRSDMQGNHEVVYPHGDARGSRFFTNATGTVMQEATYSLFGKVTSDTGSQTSIAYSDNLWNGGDHFPEVGITILGARVYDPELGRFIQRDPIMNLSRSITANAYAFAFNDPVNLTDPTGMQPPYVDTPYPQKPCVPCFSGTIPTGSTSRESAFRPKVGNPHLNFGGIGAAVSGSSRVRRPITARRVAEFAWTNNPLNPFTAPDRVRGFLSEAKATVDYAGKTISDCYGIASCVAGKSMADTLSGIGSLVSVTLQDPGGVAEALCPADNCNQTAGRIAFQAIIARLSQKMLAGPLDDLGRRPAPDAPTAPPAPAPAPAPSPARIVPGSLPPAEEAAVLRTMNHIDSGTLPTDATRVRWAQRFDNREGHLPGASGAASPYKEYRVTPQPGMPGNPTRIVVDHVSGEMYYTWTHYVPYQSSPAFVKVR